MVALAELAERGVHAPDRMPFRHPWTDRTGQELIDGTVAYHRGAREEWRVERWALPLAVFTRGETIGCIELRGDDWGWRHDDADGPNGPSHGRASVAGAQVLVPLRDGALALGRYQAIFLCEFDGPKPRSVHVTVL